MDYPLGQVREVKVIKITDFGAFVELEPGIEGLVHVSELSNERIDDPKSIISEGDVIKAEIITLDPKDRKIGLSIKSLTGEEEEGDMTEYGKAAKATPKTTEKATLGDLVGNQIGIVGEQPESEGASASDEMPEEQIPEEDKAEEEKPETAEDEEAPEEAEESKETEA